MSLGFVGKDHPAVGVADDESDLRQFRERLVQLAYGLEAFARELSALPSIQRRRPHDVARLLGEGPRYGGDALANPDARARPDAPDIATEPRLPVDEGELGYRPDDQRRFHF